MEGTLRHQVFPKTKKLVLVSAISTPMTKTRREVVETVKTAREDRDGEKSKSENPNLTQVLCIQYPITFRKNSVPISVLFDLGSKFNAIHLIFA